MSQQGQVLKPGTWEPAGCLHGAGQEDSALSAVQWCEPHRCLVPDLGQCWDIGQTDGSQAKGPQAEFLLSGFKVYNHSYFFKSLPDYYFHFKHNASELFVWKCTHTQTFHPAEIFASFDSTMMLVYFE